MADRRINLSERDYAAALRLVEKVEKAAVSYRHIAKLFGSDPARMIAVFRTRDKWDNDDLERWKRAFRSYNKHVKRERDAAGSTEIKGVRKKGRGRKENGPQKEVHIRRKTAMKNQIMCEGLMKQIRANQNFKLAEYDHTCARQFDYLFIHLIPAHRKRQNKLALMFAERFRQGDDIYLRYILEIIERAPEITMQLSERYKQEVNSLGAKR